MYTEDHSIWRKLDGTPIADSLLYWNPSQPRNEGGSEFYVSAWFDQQRMYLGDVPGYSGNALVCEMPT